MRCQCQCQWAQRQWWCCVGSPEPLALPPLVPEAVPSQEKLVVSIWMLGLGVGLALALAAALLALRVRVEEEFWLLPRLALALPLAAPLALPLPLPLPLLLLLRLAAGLRLGLPERDALREVDGVGHPLLEEAEGLALWGGAALLAELPGERVRSAESEGKGFTEAERVALAQGLSPAEDSWALRLAGWVGLAAGEGLPEWLAAPLSVCTPEGVREGEMVAKVLTLGVLPPAGEGVLCALPVTAPGKGVALLLEGGGAAAGGGGGGTAFATPAGLRRG